ncbi:MAG: efflux RND transporter periplasmic adaptor subunit [Sphingomonadaceae bacterium]|nr:efflux RND transporter periplasmic adaptor subunit [Sphingomonadaceae bacterium]
MALRILPTLALVAVLAALPACSDTQVAETAQGEVADPLAGLDIKDATAKEISEVPIGSVPGVVTLPPEARVAVTAPFPGAAVRVYVIEGQAVRRGQALALVRSAEPVQIRGDLARAQAEVGLAEARAKRLVQLADEGVIAQARADEARAALAQARASLAEQRRLTSLAGAGPDGTMTLSAPISGRVAHVGVETGGPVDGMSAPFVIEATGAYQIELQLPERLAKSVRPGMSVQVMVTGDDGTPVEVGGQVLTVAPSIDPATRSVLARASIGAAPGIVAGRNVSVTISGNAGGSGVAIPASAITRIGDADHVFVKKGKSYEARKVTVVSRAGDNAVIGEGLKAGETVAASSVAELKAMSAE